MSSESENASESRAVADPSNVHWIRHYCTTYPDMKLVLSHSARGFQPEHNLEGLPQLADLPNLYFDSSINCEPTAHEAIIRIMGHDRLLYGTDYPCCHILGKYLALGSGAQRHSGRGRVLEQRPSCVRKVSARVRGVDRRCVGLLTL